MFYFLFVQISWAIFCLYMFWINIKWFWWNLFTSSLCLLLPESLPSNKSKQNYLKPDWNWGKFGGYDSEFSSFLNRGATTRKCTYFFIPVCVLLKGVDSPSDSSHLRWLCVILKTVAFFSNAGSAWPACPFMLYHVSRTSLVTAREVSCENNRLKVLLTLFI